MSDERFEKILAELEGEMDDREREQLAARLAIAAEPVEPGAAVRDRVMERIERSDARRRAPTLRAWRSAGALAAAAAVAAWVVYFFVAPDRLEPRLEPESEVDATAELEALLEEQDEEMAALERELQDARDALSVLGAERVERLELVAAGDLAASARVYWDWDEYSCYFVAKGLPAAQAGRTYVLWLHTDQDETLLAGSFAAAGGPASFFAMLPKEMGHVVRAVVTEEPEPLGEAPSGVPLLAGGGERSPTG